MRKTSNLLVSGCKHDKLNLNSLALALVYEHVYLSTNFILILEYSDLERFRFDSCL